MSDIQKIEVFDNLVRYVKNHGGKVKYKSDSVFWSHMPKKLRTTGITLGKTIWLPERDTRLVTLIHETSHLKEILETSMFKWFFEYLMPQSILFLWFLMSIALTVINTSLWPMIAISAILTAMPWPSKSRLMKEGRAYIVSLYFKRQFYGKISERYKNNLIDSLCGWLYYKMIWTRHGAEIAFSVMNAQSKHHESLIKRFPEVKDIEEIING